MTIYTAKLDELIGILEDDLSELNRDIVHLNTQKQVYLKLLGDLKDLKEIE